MLAEVVSGENSARADHGFDWTVHLLRVKPERLGVVIAVAAFAAVCAFLLFHNVFMALLTVVAVFARNGEYLLPLNYSFDVDAVRVRCGPLLWLEMPWQSVKTWYKIPDGFKLSPFETPQASRLESVRGIRLRVPMTLRERVARELSARVGGETCSVPQ
jgi:hypothetical protein